MSVTMTATRQTTADVPPVACVKDWGREGDSMQPTPNILLITDDEHRWECLAGGDRAWCATPTIDRLRAEGTTVHNLYSSSPVCMPTRHTWLTGLCASQTERGPATATTSPMTCR
jgi:arylsulfatase A-like enzyme